MFVLLAHNMLLVVVNARQALRTHILPEMQRHFAQKSRSSAPFGAFCAISAAVLRQRKNQSIHSPGHTHITEAPFLFKLFVILQGARMRKPPFFHADQEYEVKFQTLGRMESHERSEERRVGKEC